MTTKKWQDDEQKDGLQKNKELRVIYPWQQAAWDQLCQQLDARRLPHALLLRGVVNSGLESFATLFAQYLLCAAPLQHKACGVCRECRWLSVGTHSGLLDVVPETNDKGVVSKVIKIDQIRAVIDVVTQTALYGGRKVVMITPADAMNINAANALLKNLEEPPAQTFFILISHNPLRLMATIRSRCQSLDLPLSSAVQADQWLSTEIPDASQRQQLFALSGNNPLQVERWQQQGSIDALLKMGTELRELASGQCSVLPLASQWNKSPLPERMQWWWSWLALQLKQRTLQTETAPLPASETQLHKFMQKLLVAKRHLESAANPNELLLLEALLIDWQQLCNS